MVQQVKDPVAAVTRSLAWPKKQKPKNKNNSPFRVVFWKSTAHLSVLHTYTCACV